MKVFDCHLHADSGLVGYDLAIENANVIYNSVDSYLKRKEEYQQYNRTLIFDYKDNFEIVLAALDTDTKLIGVKIHSRIQKIAFPDLQSLVNYLTLIPKKFAIVYDAFYFGSDLQFQPDLAMLIRLIEAFPDRRFIVAHCGGYQVLRYFFHLREFSNILFDLSFSLQYLQDSSCFLDLKKLIRYTDKSRLAFGSDFPFAMPSRQKEILELILFELKVSDSDIDSIFFNNYLEFLS